ncbi:YheT family hydrolase [Pseudobdellovibrio exovorus]|uniref:AB hydrolase-1 domain-containing protein n=1 Tax=Pseudobdellovibrio exovorus JSS TaxID=1184267 RepID=M4VA59_9BACT|nr:alpha/beta fold hydrolase [Pseudobdellovibrio exovorus]AGH96093.1 hypothetical protein A11Q_1877 [Pseudobdellovibrio exovorus JSS]
MRSSFSKVELELDPFVPYLPFATGHTQTVLGHIVPSEKTHFGFDSQVLTLPDGDELLLEYVDNQSAYTVSLYHGLAGDAQSDYIRRSAILAQRLGWNIVQVNHRGIRTHARQTYHSGRGEDASEVIKWCRQRFPDTQQIAVGFSMSGSILLNLLSLRYGEEQPDYAVVVNAPLDLAKSARLLSAGFSRVYDMRFCLLLKKMIEERKGEKVHVPLWARTTDIDDWYTSKLNGFADALDYYTQCSSMNYVDRIQTKTFVLSSYDDPFIDVQDYLTAPWSSSVHLSLQRYGGHMGYFSKQKNTSYGRRWLDHYLESVFCKILKSSFE